MSPDPVAGAPVLEERLVVDQLVRMRGMTVEYHRQFFANTRLALVLVLGLFTLGFWANPAVFLLIPFLALWAAVQTAFDASYLMFARHYAARLEDRLNTMAGKTLLVGARMEHAYLFPLHRRKIVTIAWGNGFSWFGYVTVFFTLLGITAYGYGVALGWNSVLSFQPGVWRVGYLAVLFLLTMLSLIAGIWWFVLGTGERRLTESLADFAGSVTE